MVWNIPEALNSLSDQRPLRFSITWEDLCFSPAPILPSAHLPVSSGTKGCCQQLGAEVAGTGKIKHSSNCSSPLYFGDSPLIPPSRTYRHIMKKWHSPTHQLVATETIHSSNSPLRGCSWRDPGKEISKSSLQASSTIWVASYRP